MMKRNLPRNPVALLPGARATILGVALALTGCASYVPMEIPAEEPPERTIQRIEVGDRIAFVTDSGLAVEGTVDAIEPARLHLEDTWYPAVDIRSLRVRQGSYRGNTVAVTALVFAAILGAGLIVSVPWR